MTDLERINKRTKGMKPSNIRMGQPTTKPSHTPTPWNQKGRWIRTDDYTSIARMIMREGDGSQEKADAAFIVRAVNSHEELLMIVKHFEIDLKTQGTRPDALTLVRRAIAKAEGKE